VVLPVTSWAEHSGTYVNAKGLRQISEKALEPQGSSQSAWKLLGAVAACLGHEASWRTLRSVRSHLLGKESSLDESISSAAPNPAE